MLSPLKRRSRSEYLSAKLEELLEAGDEMLRDCDAVRLVGINETDGRGISASG